MKKAINCMPMKIGILFFVTLFFLAAFVQASEAHEMTPFYKSWLQEHSYVHPSLKPKTQSAPAKEMTHSKAMATAKPATPKKANGSFWKGWLQEHSYAHPGIGSSAAVATPAKISKAAPASAEKKSTPKYKKRPEFNVCNFVCLSTCKSCNKSSSSNYLMSRE